MRNIVQIEDIRIGKDFWRIEYRRVLGHPTWITINIYERRTFKKWYQREFVKRTSATYDYSMSFSREALLNKALRLIEDSTEQSHIDRFFDEPLNDTNEVLEKIQNHNE